MTKDRELSFIQFHVRLSRILFLWHFILPGIRAPSICRSQRLKMAVSEGKKAERPTLWAPALRLAPMYHIYAPFHHLLTKALQLFLLVRFNEVK